MTNTTVRIPKFLWSIIATASILLVTGAGAHAIRISTQMQELTTEVTANKILLKRNREDTLREITEIKQILEKIRDRLEMP